MAVVLSMLVLNGWKYERGDLMAGYSAMTFTWTVVVVSSVWMATVVATLRHWRELVVLRIALVVDKVWLLLRVQIEMKRTGR